MAYYWSIDAEAGPSRLRDPPERSKKEKSTRKRRKATGHLLPVIPILSFLTPSFAQQTPPSRPYPPPLRPTPTPVRRSDDDDEDSDVVYATKVITPTDLPTDIVTLDQTVLPYYLTQAPEGGWGVAENAWKLYGREAGSVQNGAFVGGPPNGQFLVESSLPKGWGQQSSRTSIYRVPLISIASVLLALAIVIGIVSLVLNRRKAARKAKRRAERQRRKALIAAGLNPDSTNGDQALQQKIAELDTQHWMKKKKGGEYSFVRVKVKKWSHGLRKRKGKGEQVKEPEPTIEVIEPKPEEDESTPASTPVSSVVAEDFTDRSDPSSATSSAIGSRDAEESSQERRESGPYLPPEYRPASVNEYPMQEAGPSSGRVVAAVEAPVGDKTNAPGYYPAPATQDMEEAVAVVSHAEGKRPLPPPSEEEERVRHIATDDKRVLEQLRLGASAPPQIETSDEAGPSAPQVDVDIDGFERSEILESVLAPSSSSVPLHPDLPAPPQPPIQRLAAEPTDELHLVPSEPPRLATPLASPSVDQSSLVPSAPPLEPEEEDHPTAPEAGPSAPAPSAPVFEVGDSDETEDDGELESEPRHADVTAPTAPSVFLPKYEP